MKAELIAAILTLGANPNADELQVLQTTAEHMPSGIEVEQAVKSHDLVVPAFSENKLAEPRITIGARDERDDAILERQNEARQDWHEALGAAQSTADTPALDTSSQALSPEDQFKARLGWHTALGES
jgi:hypothetical protein